MSRTLFEGKTKSELVREVLESLGDELPSGWVAKVKEKLKEKNADVDSAFIYQIKSRFKNPQKPEKPAKAAKTKTATKNKSDGTYLVSDIVAINEFAKQYGGMANLATITSELSKAFE